MKLSSARAQVHQAQTKRKYKLFVFLCVCGLSQQAHASLILSFWAVFPGVNNPTWQKAKESTEPRVERARALAGGLWLRSPVSSGPSRSVAWRHAVLTAPFSSPALCISSWSWGVASGNFYQIHKGYNRRETQEDVGRNGMQLLLCWIENVDLCFGSPQAVFFEEMVALCVWLAVEVASLAPNPMSCSRLQGM